MKRIIFLLFCIFFIFGCDDEKHLTVMTAASLTEVIEVVSESYSEKEEAKVSLNFAGSQALAHQILNGAEADIMISANKKYIIELEENGFIESYTKIAGNKLVIAVNTAKFNINEMEDLLKDGVKIAVADESVPVGNYTKKALEELDKDYPGFAEKFNKNVVSKSLSVKEVAAKVELGEADCGIVYMTDCNYQNKEKIKTIEISDKYNVNAEYFAGVILGSKNKEEAQNYVEFLKGQNGIEIFKKYNFITK